jgi:two-component system, cell cycle sensor histidine kinase and response regulator CckA
MDSKKTVLVVDDHDDIVELVKCMLAIEGFTIIDGCSGEDALYLNERYPFPIHLLLTDVRMSPDMNGCDLARAMRVLRPTIKVVYMSGFTEDRRVEKEIGNGMAAWLKKPFTHKDLINTVNQALTLQPHPH